MSPSETWRSIGPRSLLFFPADRAPELLPKALASGADGVIVDLEDAVAPAMKAAARETLLAAIGVERPTIPVLVRVNPLDTVWGHDDLAKVAGTLAAGIVLPKVERVADVQAASAAMGPNRGILALIETPAGILAAADVARADGIVGLAFGAEDLSAQLGVRRSRLGHELLYARSHVVMAAAAAGRWALDSPCTEPRGITATRREALRARSLGYVGKLLIHPAQVAPAHEAFAPTRDEIALASKVVDAFTAMDKLANGVANLDGQMIDRPTLVAAERILARTRQVVEESE